jgi:hypothetical protein
LFRKLLPFREPRALPSILIFPFSTVRTGLMESYVGGRIGIKQGSHLPNHLLVASNCNHLILSDGQICSIETEKETTETPFDT